MTRPQVSFLDTCWLGARSARSRLRERVVEGDVARALHPPEVVDGLVAGDGRQPHGEFALLGIVKMAFRKAFMKISWIRSSTAARSRTTS